MKVWHVLLFSVIVAGGAIWLGIHRADVALLDSAATFTVPEIPPLTAASCGTRCGVQRWPVKTLSDPDRERVGFTPTRTTIAELATLARPDRRPQDGRVAPIELSTFQVEGFLVGWSPQDDGDIHLILADPDVPGMTMVAEIPDPSCQGVCNSGLAGYFVRARQRVNAILNRPNPNDELIRLRVVGVGFFDHNHGQTGAAPNFIELHPVLEVVEVR